MRIINLVLGLFLVFLVPSALADSITIVLISDGEGARENIPVNQLKNEIRQLLEPQYEITFLHRSGEWQEAGVSNALNSALNDSNIDIIITEGLVGTHMAGKISELSKPVIGTFVPEPRIQGLPLTDENTSGKNNYVYISDLQSFDNTMENVLSILPDKKIALIADELIANGVPMLANPDFYGDYEVQMITANASVDQLVSKLPNNIGSVLLAPLPRLSDHDINRLAQVFIERGLPSVGFANAGSVRDGILMSVGSEQLETQKYARRVALNILSVLEGKNASELLVKMQYGQNLQYNTTTAEALGFELPWEMSLTAQAYSSDRPSVIDNRNAMSLNDAVNLALDHNINLAQQTLQLEIAAADLSIARSNWWPQVTLTGQASYLDDKITSIANPERSVDATAGLSQLIYSEQAKANSDVAKLSYQVSQYQLDAVILDTIQNASTAYLSVLRAKALEKVQRSNLTTSVQNLELAENRFALGAVTESDVLRWKSQIATDKRNLLSAQAGLRNAIIGLQNFLHQPYELRVDFDESDTQRLIKLSLDKEARDIFDSPSERRLMRQYILASAINNSPEIKQIDTVIAINARNTKAARRAFYLPDVSLSVQQNDNLGRSGLFSNQADASLPDSYWSVGVVASYPIFQGRKRQANLAKAQHQEQQTRLDSDATKDNLQANALNQWNAITSSYPAIFLSQEAANAALKTLEMITEQYSSGAINITTLIEAQNAALSAELAATEAQYTYLIDYVNLSRAVADFRTITDVQDENSWFDEFNQFRSQANVDKGISNAQ